MIRFKINVAEALNEQGITSTACRPSGRYSGLFGQTVLGKFRNSDPNINLDTLGKLCLVLNMQPADLIEFVNDGEEFPFPSVGSEDEDE